MKNEKVKNLKNKYSRVVNKQTHLQKHLFKTDVWMSRRLKHPSYNT